MKKVRTEYDLTEIIAFIDEYKLGRESREEWFGFPRFYLYSYLRHYTNLRLREIGALFNRDHATISYGLNQAKQLKNDKKYIEYTEKVREIFPFEVRIERLSNSLNPQIEMYQSLGKMDSFLCS